MKNKKGLMRLDQFFLAVILFSAVIVGGVLIISDLGDNYQVTIGTERFNNSLSNITATYEVGQETKNSTIGADISEESTEDALFSGGFEAARGATSNSFTIFGLIIEDIADALPIPRIFIQIAITALTILLLFALIYLVFRIIPN